MARIKNMGASTVRFNEGVIVDGTAGDDVHALIVTGSVYVSNGITGSVTNATNDQFGDTLLGGIYAIDHGIFQNPPTGYTRIYFPSEDSFTERVGPSTVNFNIAPFAGEIIKISIKSSVSYDTRTLTCSFHKGTGAASTYSATPTTSITTSGLKAWDTHTFDFMGQGATFSETDVIGFGLSVSGDFDGSETVHFTTVVKYNPFN